MKEKHKDGVDFSLEMTLVKFKAKNKAASRALHGPDGERILPRAIVVEHLLNQRITNTHSSPYLLDLWEQTNQNLIYN